VVAETVVLGVLGVVLAQVHTQLPSKVIVALLAVASTSAPYVYSGGAWVGTKAVTALSSFTVTKFILVTGATAYTYAYGIPQTIRDIVTIPAKIVEFASGVGPVVVGVGIAGIAIAYFGQGVGSAIVKKSFPNKKRKL